ncbi:MAG: sodium-dependent transporter, partial [Bradymonadaceae bacterium]
FNTLVSLVAAVVMFSIIFSQGGEPAKGPGLAFVTIPKLFAQLPGGTILAVVFFLLLAFAAITSAISLLEVVVSYFVEELDYDRGVAVVAFGGLIFVLGVPSALGFNIWSDVTFQVGGGDAKNILGTIDHFVANYALALGALGTALYAGWAVEEREWRDEIAEGPMKDLLFAGWLWLVRLIGPTAVVLVILSKLGLI